MRRVKVFKRKAGNKGNNYVSTKVDDYEGLFHGWGSDFEEFESGAGNYSTAIIERSDGTIDNAEASLIQFIDPAMMDPEMNESPHIPMQPIGYQGAVIRFVPNEIVKYILDNGGIDMNQIAIKEFSQRDQEQFAQLIGYSVSAYGSLDYVSKESQEKADFLAACL